MGSFHSFAQMLEKKIRREIEQESRANNHSHSENHDFPSEPWTRLVGELGPIQFQSSLKAHVYHRNRPAPKPRPPHVFNEAQHKAWSFFQSHLEVPLAPNFSKSELKHSFRVLALRLHPDHGGTSSQFQELIRARQILEALFS